MSLRACLLSILALLALACGGGGRTTYPGPESITLTVEEPSEGAISASPRLTLYGRVSQTDAFVACNDQPVFVNASGLFQTIVPLKSGENEVVLKAWSAEEARKGRGSSLLPLGQVATTLIRKVVYRGPSLTLKVNTPVEGARFTAPQIAVSGSVSDAATVTLNGNPLVVAESGSFQGTFDLQPGANALVFLASASGGRSATETRNVVYEPPVPGAIQVAITGPAEGLLTNASTINVTGTLSDPTASLTLNGQAVTPAANGTWSLTLSPPEGAVTLLATATKGATTAQDQRNIVVDRTPPVISLNSPLPGTVSSPALSLVGTVDDPTAALTLAGQNLPLSATGAFSTQLALNEGANALHFRAVDPAGNVGVLDVSTTYTRTGAAPVVVFDTPLDGYATTGSSVLVKGHVDDPGATLLLQGEQTPIDPLGNFERLLSAAKMGVMAIRAEATNSYGTGKAGIYVTFDETPPVLAWADPTPAQGSRLTASVIPAAVLINKAALTTINGGRTELEPSGDAAMPFKASAELSVQEGQVVLTATAVDAAGNEATITRDLEVGLTAPTIVVDAPIFDAKGRFSTVNPGLTLTGSVSAPDAVKPLTLTVNGTVTALSAEGRFSLPMNLVVGDNPAKLVATNRFQQSTSKSLVVARTSGISDPGQDTTPGIRIDWPQTGFASGTPQIAVKGRVLVPGMSATLNGANVAVDPQTLVFTGTVTLNPGDNLIQATGTDAQGRVATDQIQGRYITKEAVKYTWLSPLNGARTKTRTVAITGKADQPGVLSITVNEVPMTLDPVSGAFSGTVSLAAKGKNALLLQATTLGGEALDPERREVIFQPELPVIRLVAPETARPGASVSLQVLPEAGTSIVAADLSIDGRLVARIAPPFPAQAFTIPADAAVGSRLAVEAVGTDAEGETVTARAYITVYDAGALLQKVLDDRSGLPMEAATVAIEGGESGLTDASGRVALATALPANWIKISKEGTTPVWRSAALKRSGIESSLDARLSPLEPAAVLPASIAKGALALQGAGSASATPLSSQGLPGLLPAGWSAISAWWITVESPATAALKLDAALPSGGTYAWARWDETRHLWVALATAANPAALAVPQSGGYALLMPDPDPTTPPAAVEGQAVPAFQGNTWTEGFVFNTGDGPTTMSTADAINGARIEAFLKIAFSGKAPIPSGTVIQADLLESYTLADARVIEPASYTQDLLAHRWALTVVDGAPVLQSAGEGLLLKQPVRMSRTFNASELVQGRLLVGFYHDGVRVADTGSGLVDANGGSLTHGGITVSLPAGAVSGSALVRILPDSGDLAALWPELAGKGSLKQSFQIDVVGSLLKGLGLSLATLDAPDDARPLVLQRRVVQGQRLVVAVGELKKSGSTWSLVTPPGGNPVMEGGSFSILLPAEAWDWISGTATMPEAAASSLIVKLGAKAGMKTLAISASSPSAPSVSVADVKVDAGFVLAASGANGVFAVPALASATPITVNGSRWDLGLTGTLSAPVPSTGNSLVLATVPFAVETLLPNPGSPVPPATAFQVLTTGPIDPASIVNARIFNNGSEVSLRRSLSQDGRILLLTPEQPLVLGNSYQLVIDGLTALTGGTAPKVDQTYQVQAPAAAPSPVDFSKIKLSYPDASFNITVTIPQGAIPARTKVEVEAPGMGSVGTATMPDSGEQVFQLKASLGERLKIQAELPSGQVVTGYLSRYEAGDGTGRVTLGVDGGRVESGDGKAAATFPEGALEAPVEVKVEFTTEVPAELDATIAAQEKIAGRIRVLTSSTDVQLKKRPVLEISAPENPSTAQHTDGLGAYAVYDRVDGFEPDGSPCTYFELSDTAALNNGKLKSMGGIPENLSIPTDEAVAGASSLAKSSAAKSLVLNTSMGTGRIRTDARASVSKLKASAKGITAQSSMFGGMFGWLLDAFMIDSGPHYISGFADVSINYGTPKPAIGASIYFGKWDTTSIKRGGTLMGHTLAPAGSYIYASFLTGELVRDGGRIMGVEKDFGVKAFSGGAPVGPGGIFGTYFHVPTLHFEVGPTEMQDHTAPWAEIRFEGSDVLSDQEARNGTEVFAALNAYDSRDQRDLVVNVSIDGNPVDSRAYTYGKNPNGSGKWGVRLCNWQTNPYTALGQGVHVIEATVADKAGNKTTLRRELRVLDFGSYPANDPAKSPEFTIEVEGGLNAAKPSTMIQVKFSEPVTGVSEASLYLEENRSGAWSKVEGVRLSSVAGAVKPAQILATVFMIPAGKLTTGASYRVVATSAIQDQDTPPKACQQAPLGFKVAQGVYLTDYTLPAMAVKMATLGNRVFTASNDPSGSRITLARLPGNPNNPPTIVTFGVPGTGANNFLGQLIDAIGVYRQVPINGNPTDLLLVTTSPRPGDEREQGVLWGFNACSGFKSPQLLFGVSIGQGSSGYAPTVDCRDGMIVVGRLGNSILLIDASKAKTGWDANQSISACISPAGINQQAIIQPFYLADPEGNGVPSHWGVGLVPDAVPGGDSAFNVAVGFSQPGAQWRGISMRGLSSARYDYSAGILGYWPEAPFTPDPASQGKGPDAPAANSHAVPGPVDGALIGEPGIVGSATRLSVWSRATVEDDTGATRTTNLVFAVSSLPHKLSDGSVLGDSIVVMEKKKDEQAKLIAAWPKDPPFGAGVKYQILYKNPSVDPITGLVAIGVQNKATNAVSWFVVDFKRPTQPKTVYTESSAGTNASISNGILSSMMPDGLSVLSTKVVEGIGGLDEGPCGPPGLIVDVSFEKPTLEHPIATLPHYAELTFNPATNLWPAAKFIKVQVMDESGQSVATDVSGNPLEGFTDEQGRIEFPGLKPGQYKVRALPHLLMRQKGAVVFEAQVYNEAMLGGDFEPRASQHEVLAWPDKGNMPSSPALSLQHGVVKTELRIITDNSDAGTRHSGPYNILWVMANGAQWVLDNQPSPRAYPKLVVGWDTYSPKSSACFYSGKQKNGARFIRINGIWKESTSEYSDAVIGHELGHYFQDQWIGSMSQGGTHPLSGEQDWGFAFSEGWATFFQGAFRSQPGNPQPGPDYFAFKWANKTQHSTLISKVSTMLSNLSPTAAPPVHPEGIWDEDASARLFWRWYASPALFAQNGGPFLQAYQGIPAFDMLTSYGFWNSLKVSQPGLAADAEKLLKLEGHVDAKGQLLSQEPWSWVNGGSPGHTQVALAGRQEVSHKENSVYYRFTPVNDAPVTVTLELQGVPSCSSLDFLRLNAFCRGRGVPVTGGKLLPDLHLLDKAKVGDTLSFSFKPQQGGVPHILRFSVRCGGPSWGSPLRFELKSIQ